MRAEPFGLPRIDREGQLQQKGRGCAFLHQMSSFSLPLVLLLHERGRISNLPLSRPYEIGCMDRAADATSCQLSQTYASGGGDRSTRSAAMYPSRRSH